MIAGTTNGSTPSLQVMTNQGNGTFTPYTHTFDGVYGGAARWVDYDGDSALDLLLTGTGSAGNTLRLYRSRDCISDLGLTKRVSPSSVLPGDEVIYTLQFQKTGPQIATRVVLTEILPVSLFSGVSFTSTLPITPVFGVPYIWQLPNIPVGEGGTIVVRGRTTFAATGATINNTATIHAREDITPTNDSATAVLTVRAPILNFVTTDLTVDENGGSATVQVQLDIPNPLGNVLVTYRSSQGTAQPGQDYTTVDNVLVIPAGQTSGSFTVPIVNDTLDEENETILLDLLNPVGAKLGAQGRAVLTIVDNDALPTLSVSGPDIVEHANVAEFVFTLSAASGRPITLTVNTINDGNGAGLCCNGRQACGDSSGHHNAESSTDR
ncbi:MAG: Calx-beta domain-containing protein [Caldilineaceae bacterium]